jgi:prepilin-type N-terminal cleavage/methylation domain-containing protein
MRFKHLKSGMSLIEVIIAIAILAIFGTSLFLMQEYLYDRMHISQKKLIANLQMQSQLITYQTNILKELFEQNGPVEKSLQEQIKEFTHPDMIIKINSRSDFSAGADQKETSFKDFKNLHLITAQAEHDEKEYGKSYIFMYIPEVAKT